MKSIYRLVLIGLILLSTRFTHAQGAADYIPIDLGTLGGQDSIAQRINSRGQIAGASETASGAIHACLWDNLVPIDLGTLGGATSEAQGINDLGHVVGY